MKSGHHALHSVGVGLIVLVTAPPPTHPVWLLGVALAVGVGIDADHFLIARWKTGSWENLRRVIDRPSMVFLDQESIFDEEEVGAVDRLVSHVVIAGLSGGLLWVLGFAYWSGVVVVTLLVHVLADVYGSARKRRRTGTEGTAR